MKLIPKKMVKKVATIKVAKAVAKYGGAALTGYEAGSMIESVIDLISVPNQPDQPNKPIEGKIELKPSAGFEQALYDMKLLLFVIMGIILLAYFLGLGYKAYITIGKNTKKNSSNRLRPEVYFKKSFESFLLFLIQMCSFSE